MKNLFCVLFIATFIVSCVNNKNDKKHLIPVTNLSDQQYLDNPDIGYRSKDYKTDLISKVNIEELGDS